MFKNAVQHMQIYLGWFYLYNNFLNLNRIVFCTIINSSIFRVLSWDYVLFAMVCFNMYWISICLCSSAPSGDCEPCLVSQSYRRYYVLLGGI